MFYYDILLVAFSSLSRSLSLTQFFFFVLLLYPVLFYSFGDVDDDDDAFLLSTNGGVGVLMDRLTHGRDSMKRDGRGGK